MIIDLSWFFEAVRKYFLIDFFKKIHHIYTCYEEDYSTLTFRLHRLEKVLKERTDIHIDAAYKGQDANQIIVIGKYKKRDYVQVFSIVEEDFIAVIKHLKKMQKYGTVKRIDSAPYLSVVMKHELHESRRL